MKRVPYNKSTHQQISMCQVVMGAKPIPNYPVLAAGFVHQATETAIRVQQYLDDHCGSCKLQVPEKLDKLRYSFSLPHHWPRANGFL